MSDARDYWRSLGELEQTPEFRRFLEREFPEGAADPPDGVTRRTMLLLLGASMSMAGLAACRRPAESIVPYVTPPEGIVPGVPLRYATTMPFGVNAYGLVVESYEGRPTKIEGNELHPATRGGSNVWVQAAIYGLYDPDRSRSVRQAGSEKTWKQFAAYWQKLREPLAATQGEGLAVLLEPFSSPSQARVVAQFRSRFPRARLVTYSPLGDENVYAGIQAATGAVYEPAYFFDRARVILSLDADFLLHDRDAIRHARDFMNGRRVGKSDKSETMSRLYVAESALSITGIAADHRLSLQSGRIAALAAALAAELGIGGGSSQPEAADFDRKWVQAVAADLKANRGQSLIVAGALQPPAVHAAVTALNAALGNVGKTVGYSDAKETARSRTEDLKSLVAAMQGGEVKTLAILGGNPVYDAPADLEFAKALEKVENRIRLGPYVDETSAAAKWHLPQAHFLESWGDARAVGGPLSVTQPLIEPLFGGRSAIEILWLLAEGAEKPGYEIVRETWKTILPSPDFERSWSRVLHDGLLEGSELAPATPRIEAGVTAALAENPLASAAPAKAEDLEIVFRPSSVVHDGQFANNAWLQELPEPVTKLTWDNAAVLSVATARELGVGDGDLVRLKYKEKEITAPVLIVPGQADHSVSLPLGYGRTAAGRVGNGVGFNAYALRTSDAAGFDRGARLERAGARHILATTHEHWSTEGRDLVREVSLQRFREDPHVVHEHPKHQPWTPIAFESRPQWGMAIDLGSCIGCNACVIACQSENNVPVVGKDQVTRGREMHWLRVDRYYSGRPEAPETVIFQPVPCMQCENAPCEQVCPVAATLHDEQGLNVMVYNRCIGTRYCSNNCPYKVRRFNFYNFTRDTPELLKLANNPDVTVRARGVMEKCSYCVQRLTRAKIDAKLEERQLEDGDVQTACQQACPTRAIEFGDIGDAESAVAMLKASGRSYELLPELNTRPRTTYLVRVRNPNPELDEA